MHPQTKAHLPREPRRVTASASRSPSRPTRWAPTRNVSSPARRRWRRYRRPSRRGNTRAAAGFYFHESHTAAYDEASNPRLTIRLAGGSGDGDGDGDNDDATACRGSRSGPSEAPVSAMQTRVVTPRGQRRWRRVPLPRAGADAQSGGR